MKKIIVLVLVLLLGGCGLIRNPFEKFEPTYQVAATDYLGAGILFNKIRPESYMKERELFSVSSESELALLVAKKLEAGITKVNYRSDHLLSLQKTFMYLESIVFTPFTLAMGYTEYTRFGNAVDKVYFAEVQHDGDADLKLKEDTDVFLAGLVLDGKTNAQQLRSIHDTLVKQTKYDTSVLQLKLEEYRGHPSFEAYGLFTNKTAVCSGYSKALMSLASTRGIPTLYVASLSMEHAWNLVYDGENWLYIDATWNDPVPDKEGRVLLTYFLLDKTRFLKDGKHHFDLSSDATLSEEEYIEFAKYVFPTTKD